MITWAFMRVSKRFWAKVDIKSDDECWNWVGGFRGGKGYGSFWVNGVNKAAHRFAWEDTNFKSVPDGMCVCHRCDNPSCCNPSHLFVGTHGDNAADRNAKGRQAKGQKITENRILPTGASHWTHQHPEKINRGEMHGNALFSNAQYAEIRSRRTDGETLPALGKEFGVGKSTIAAICKGTEPKSRFSDSDIKTMFRLRADGYSFKSIGDDFGCDKATVIKILSGGVIRRG